MKRPNKLSCGITKTLERQKKNRNLYTTKTDVLRLAVKGTTDHLGVSINYHIKRVVKEHPTDRGYFKEVFILSEKGKLRVKTYKSLKLSGLPLWEYMYANKRNCTDEV